MRTQPSLFPITLQKSTFNAIVDIGPSKKYLCSSIIEKPKLKEENLKRLNQLLGN